MAKEARIQTTCAICPDCGYRIGLGRPLWVGMPVLCPHCDAHLKVVDMAPVELDRAEVGWDAYDDFDEDEEYH